MMSLCALKEPITKVSRCRTVPSPPRSSRVCQAPKRALSSSRVLAALDAATTSTGPSIAENDGDGSIEILGPFLGASSSSARVQESKL